MVEVVQAFSVCDFVDKILGHTSEQGAILHCEGEFASAALLSMNMSERAHVVLNLTGNDSQSLIAKARRPDGIGIAVVGLVHGIFENVLSVGRPLVADVDGHLSSWEQDPINLRQQVLELSGGVVIENGNDLHASHFHGLDVAGCNVSEILVAGIVAVLGIDADYGSLLGQ